MNWTVESKGLWKVEKKPSEGGEIREPDGNFPLEMTRAQKTQKESLGAFCG